MFDLFKEKIEGSLDIGSSSLKGLRLKKSKVTGVNIRELDNGVIVNGTIEDYLTISEELKTLIEDLELKNKELVVSLPIQNFFIKFLTVTQVGEKEKLALVESELEELVPNFDPEDFITDYVNLGEVENDNSTEGEGQENIMAITILKSKVKELIEILTTLKVIPVRIVPDFVSIFNLVQMEKDYKEVTDEESVMLVDIGSEATKIFIERDGIIKMQRIVAIGGNDITEVIQRFYNTERDKAEEEKKRLELLNDHDDDEYDEDGSREIFMEVAEIFDELENQIRVSIEFYKSQERRPGIDRIFLIGGTSLIKGFKQNLEKALDLEVDEIDLTRFLSANFVSHYDLEEYPPARIAALVGSVIEEVSFR